MSKLQSPRGTADLMPQDMAAHRHVMDTARATAGLFGFEEMATPIFEFTEVFARPLGESSDVVTKETYSFTDRGGEGLTLRPEGTAGVVRALISAGLTQTLPQKFFYSGPMFRYERPQKGRMRQFHQVGVELLGPTSPLADAEVIALGARMLDRLGVLKNCRLHLNSLGDAESRSGYREALVDYLTAFKDDLSEDSQRRLTTNPLRILDSKNDGDKAILTNAPSLADHLNAASQDHFARVCASLDAAGIRYHHDPKLVRGLDYYCHTAFEFITQDLGAQGTVLGGGRYDGLVQTLGGPDVAGVGWAAGVERLALLANKAPRLEPPVFLISVDDSEKIENAMFILAQKIRGKGVRAEISFGRNLGKELKRANKLGAPYVAMFVETIDKNSIAIELKNMEDGVQETINSDDLDRAADEICKPYLG
ncbi:MAG: histidine--tRNA ligase [Alphaproteobacteria bacterium]|nr:histidine--tRNA ligase [Alphaproteobacteria bacterium]